MSGKIKDCICRFVIIVLCLCVSTELKSQTLKTDTGNSSNTPFGNGSVNNNRIVSLFVSVRLDNIQSAAPPSLRVHLSNSRTSFHAEGFTDERGEVRFSNIPYGDYAMEISGDIEGDTIVQRFDIQAGDFQHSEMVRVKYKSPDTAGNNNHAGNTIPISELSVPEDAFDELHKGWAEYQKKKFSAANKHYLAALALYPKYASAMNSLGILSLSQKDIPGADKWFELAISTDASFPDPYFNLARLAQTKDDYPDIERYLVKFTSLIPLHTRALAMLAEAQMYNGNLDDALANTRKVHLMDHRLYPEVHIIAARVLEWKHLPREAIAEYRIYLKESPDGLYAQNVHQTLDIMAQKYELPLRNQNQ